MDDSSVMRPRERREVAMGGDGRRATGGGRRATGDGRRKKKRNVAVGNGRRPRLSAGWRLLAVRSAVGSAFRCHAVFSRHPERSEGPTVLTAWL